MKIAVCTLIERLDASEFCEADPFLKALGSCKEHEFKCDYMQTSNIMSARNVYCELRIKEGFDFVWMWDSDQEFTVDDAVRLVNTAIEKGIHIISPAIIRNGDIDGVEVLNAGYYLGKAGTVKHIRADSEGGLTGCDYVGDCGVLISTEALLYTINEEWFHCQPYMDGETKRYMSWDHGFCISMVKAGYKIYIDKSLKAIHHIKIRKDINMNTENKKAVPEGGMQLTRTSFLEEKEKCDIALTKGNTVYKAVFESLAVAVKKCEVQEKTILEQVETIAKLQKQLADPVLKKPKAKS